VTQHVRREMEHSPPASCQGHDGISHLEKASRSVIRRVSVSFGQCRHRDALRRLKSENRAARCALHIEYYVPSFGALPTPWQSSDNTGTRGGCTPGDTCLRHRRRSRSAKFTSAPTRAQSGERSARNTHARTLYRELCTAGTLLKVDAWKSPNSFSTSAIAAEIPMIFFSRSEEIEIARARMRGTRH